jgi:hypothetical protein
MSARPACVAGGHWFEPSTAHFHPPFRARDRLIKLFGRDISVQIVHAVLSPVLSRD